MDSLPPVASIMANSTVLVTGATGFVGIALIEKLLRCIPNIDTIYVLIRHKRGKGKEERLKEILKNPIFDTIRNSQKEEVLNKVKALEGNIDAEELGLNVADFEIVKKSVNYVFHCAATLDFEASLKTTVEINLLGTRRVIDLCHCLQHLKCLVHVSSAYVNANRLSAEEVLYPPPDDVNKVIELVNTLSDNDLDEITPKLLKNHPNTYTFTKALAEHEVADSFNKETFTACIVRPSMIVGSWKEPVPGWTNSKNGPQGFIMGAAMGVVRRLPVGKHLIYDYIPVDVVVNTMIVSAVHTATFKETLDEAPIYQCTSSTYKPFRWVDVEDQVSHLLHKYPLLQAVWYPHLKLLPSVTHYRISAVIFHQIPAYFFDFLTKIMGGRPRLVTLHRNINKSLDRLAPFIFTEWMFDNKAMLSLHNKLKPSDQEVFCMDIKTLEWDPFFDDMAKGVRRYLHKEEDKTLPKARVKHNVLFVLNVVLQVAIFGLVYLLLTDGLGLSWAQAASALPFVYFLYCLL